MAEFNKIEKCPCCGGTRMGFGKQTYYGGVSPIDKFLSTSQDLYHKICLNCGTVVRSYVKNPQKFAPKEKK